MAEKSPVNSAAVGTVAEDRLAIGFPISLVVAEEEELIVLDRTAEIGAELVLVPCLSALALAIGKEVISVEHRYCARTRTLRRGMHWCRTWCSC